MKLLKGLGIFILGSFLLLVVIGNLLPEPSRESGVMNVQRILIARHMGWETRAITGIGHSQTSVTRVGEN